MFGLGLILGLGLGLRLRVIRVRVRVKVIGLGLSLSKIKLFCRDVVFGKQEFFHRQLGRVRKLWTDPEEAFVEQGVELGFVAMVRVAYG